MGNAADILASATYWTILTVSCGGAFFAGFHYTQGATSNVPVKQPVMLGQRQPTPIPVATPIITTTSTPKPSPKPSPKPTATPTLVPGPIPVSLPPEQTAFSEGVPPGGSQEAFQAPSGDRTLPPADNPGDAGGAATVYRVQVGAFDTREGAQRQVEALQAQGINAVVVWDGGSYRAQLGAFSDRARAFFVADEINARGFPVTVRR
ncbi:MAG: SPOR domain-containing protein [Candidatus Sericytochromatia bacterium]|nr:SPOR domain-containing protein [Candidatus Sericytochromatia bacterium]